MVSFVSVLFSPLPEEMIQFFRSVFQIDWNHQLDLGLGIILKTAIICPDSDEGTFAQLDSTSCSKNNLQAYLWIAMSLGLVKAFLLRRFFREFQTHIPKTWLEMTVRNLWFFAGDQTLQM